MKIDFNKQTVLITGATRGIGKQLADDFEKLGAELILTGTKRSQIEALNRIALKSSNCKKTFYCVDFTNKKGTEQFAKALSKYKKIDVCINNAGINRINLIENTKTKDWDDIISVNLRAPYIILRKISGLMKKNKYGRIVNISSIFGTISREKRSIYSISKFGLRGLTVAASNELARHNVLVNAVSPGFVLTELTKQILSLKEMRELKTQIPRGRLASPSEISRVVLFLASPMNTYLTGQNIIVDGGYVNV